LGKAKRDANEQVRVGKKPISKNYDKSDIVMFYGGGSALLRRKTSAELGSRCEGATNPGGELSEGYGEYTPAGPPLRFEKDSLSPLRRTLSRC